MSRSSTGFGVEALAVLVMLLLASCCRGSPGPTDESSVASSPVVLKDTSPNQLRVFVGITLGGYDSSTRDRALVDVGFQANGRPVKFVADEAVTCNEIPLNRFIGAFEATLSRTMIEGKSMRCRYSYRQRSAPIAFGVPCGLVILSPREHESVTASPQTTVDYRAAADATPWVVAFGSRSKVWARPDATTSTRATLDTSALRGAGSIFLTQQFDLKDIQAPQFQSIAGRVTSMTVVAVTWV